MTITKAPGSMSTRIGHSSAPPSEPDPLLTEPTGMPQVPRLRDELPPLRPPILEINPVNRRMENLDAMRVLCMGVIVMTHVTEPYLDTAYRRHGGLSGPLTLGLLAVNSMARFGVPVFMMISFFIYWHQLYEKGRTWGELLARRFRRLIPAFLVWTAVYFLIHKALYKHFDHAGTRELQERFWTSLGSYKYSLKDWHTWARALFYGQAEYHLYYLPLVMQCLLLIPLLRLLWRRPAIAWAWIGATSLAWAFVLYGPVLFAAESRPAAWSHRFYNVMNQPWAVPFLVFPLFGMMCAGQRACRNFVAHSSTAFWVALLIFGLALHASEAIGLAKILSPGDKEYFLRVAVLVKTGRLITGGAVFALFLRRPLMRDPLPKVSHFAFGLHFMHPAVIIAITLIELRLFPSLATFDTMILPTLALNLVLTLGITFGLCLVIGRMKKLEFLVV